jgi:2-oxoglutarate dehydrogenase E2 component (dihydrolipoamide succinyltransferase)
MSFFTKAVTRALQLYPDVNSMMDGDHKIAFDFAIFHCSFRTKAYGSVVQRWKLTFRGVEADIKGLAIKARDGQITVDDMTGDFYNY